MAQTCPPQPTLPILFTNQKNCDTILKWDRDINWTGSYPSAIDRIYQTYVGQDPSLFIADTQGFLRIGHNTFATFNQGPRNEPAIVGNGTVAALSGVNQSDRLFETIGTLGMATNNTQTSRTDNYVVGVDGEAFYHGFGTLQHLHGVLGLGLSIGGFSSHVQDLTGGTFQAFNSTGGAADVKTDRLVGVMANAWSNRSISTWGASFWGAANPLTELPSGTGGSFTRWATLYLEDGRQHGTSESWAIRSDGGNVTFRNSQTVINADAPVANAQLQVDSTTRGFLPPRMTTAQRDAIASPAAGVIVFNTTTAKLNFFDGTAWQALGVLCPPCP